MQTERPTSGPSPRGGSPLLDDRTNARIERRRGWTDSRATSWRTCRPSFAGRTWRNPPSSLCKRNSRPSSGWGCRRRKTSSGNRCAHESESESSASLTSRGFEILSNECDAGGTRRGRDAVHRSIRWRRSSLRLRRLAPVVVALGRRRGRIRSRRKSIFTVRTMRVVPVH